MSTAPSSRAAAALRAATSLPALVVVGASATLAVALHAPAIAALGVVATSALAATELLRPSPNRPSGRPELPTRDQLTDPAIAQAIVAIVAARARVEEALAATPASLAADLTRVLAQVEDLDVHAAVLARRGEDISQHLRRTDPNALRSEADLLRKRIASTADAATRAALERACVARAQHLTTLRDLTYTKERIVATLVSICATLDALPPRLVRLRSLEASAGDTAGSVESDLSAMSEELSLFESSLVELSEQGLPSR